MALAPPFRLDPGPSGAWLGAGRRGSVLPSPGPPCLRSWVQSPCLYLALVAVLLHELLGVPYRYAGCHISNLTIFREIPQTREPWGMRMQTYRPIGVTKM